LFQTVQLRCKSSSSAIIIIIIIIIVLTGQSVNSSHVFLKLAGEVAHRILFSVPLPHTNIVGFEAEVFTGRIHALPVAYGP